jgi:hypothetical protein
VYGYAARVVLLEPTDHPSLERSAFQLNAQSNVERLANDAATPKRLLDPVGASRRTDSTRS